MGCLLKGGGGLYSRLVVGGVLLAAGAGSRLGHRPKSLLELGGVPLIRRQIIALSGAGIDELVVVLGHYAEQIEPLVQDFPVTLVRNPRPDEGQASSLRLGLAGLAGKLDAVVVGLADQPLINAQDVSAVIAAYKKRPEGCDVVVPRVGNERGNPVMFTAAILPEILAGDVNFGCRQWQQAHPERVHFMISDNPRYCLDIDEPADIAALAARTGHQLKWPTELTQAR
ncbi:MAG: nucleotidyltransferase family protein [Candidatus Symbiobacter sp.]|nr:nucleotidyltransferase family protein [Candidatus Symbiobacter sp.]